MNRRFRATPASMLAALFVLHSATSLRAQFAGTGEAPAGIAVQGVGEVKARPNLVEIDLRTSGSGEITGDALVKYQDSKRRTLEAFEKLKMANLKIEEGGLSINGAMTPQQLQVIQQGLQNQAIKVPVQIGGVLHLKLSGVQEMQPLKLMETIGSLLDVAKDAGVGLGPTAEQINYGYNYQDQPLCRFVLQDFQPLREQAYKAAVADARSRAQRLADLNNVALGQVLGVQEIELPGDEQDPNTIYQIQAGIYQTQPAQSSTQPRITSHQFTEVAVRVKLLVRYAIEPLKAKTASK